MVNIRDAQTLLPLHCHPPPPAPASVVSKTSLLSGGGMEHFLFVLSILISNSTEVQYLE